MEDSNRSANADIHSVSDPARRIWLHGGLAALAGAALAPLFAGCAGADTNADNKSSGPPLSFESTPTTEKDTLVVTEDGYEILTLP